MLGVLCVCFEYVTHTVSDQTLFYIGKSIIETELRGMLVKTGGEPGRVLHCLLGS